MPKVSSTKKRPKKRKAIVLPPGAGRSYPMGRINSIFKADNEETAGTYSVSEWWMDANTKGPGAHVNDNDHVYYVLEGTMSVFLEDTWTDCTRGACIIIPGGVLHTFENRGTSRAGILSFDNEAGFENRMPSIVKWFEENPPEDAR